mmetsp:Transcript_11377/g.11388  ORF Transcript_11377/g.11388 Transcript_11377/m.11388 type:complete len:114 (+) Transcript_11377:1154-1495(+)
MHPNFNPNNIPSILQILPVPFTKVGTFFLVRDTQFITLVDLVRRRSFIVNLGKDLVSCLGYTYQMHVNLKVRKMPDQSLKMVLELYIIEMVGINGSKVQKYEVEEGFQWANNP